MSALTVSARENFAACVATMVLTAIAVFTRFGMRFSLGQRLLGSDWLCLLSLVFFYAYCIVIINFIFNVSKFHAFDAGLQFGLDELRNLLIASFALEILMSCVITTVKFSILWFYYSIFGVSPNTRRAIYATGVICIIWFFIAVFPLIVFQCSPVDAYWNQFNLPPACKPTQHLLLGYELTNFFIDVAILCIPIGAIGKLQLARSKKIGTAVMFLLGTFVCVASIVRLTYIYDARDPSKQVQTSPAIMWSTIQQGIAIVCSCLPTLGPLLKSIDKPFLYLSDRFGTSATRGSNTTDTSSRRKIKGLDLPMKSGSWARVGAHEDQSSHTWADTNYQKNHAHVRGTLPPKGIVVDRDVEMA